MRKGGYLRKEGHFRKEGYFEEGRADWKDAIGKDEEDGIESMEREEWDGKEIRRMGWVGWGRMG